MTNYQYLIIGGGFDCSSRGGWHSPLPRSRARNQEAPWTEHKGQAAKTAKDGQAVPKGLEGALVTRAAMGVDVLARLHQQIQQVLVSMRDARQLKPKA